MDKLNIYEQAAICFHILGECEDRTALFKIANGAERYDNLTDKSKTVTVSRWYNSVKIQDGIKNFQAIQDRKTNEIKTEILKALETETTKNESSGEINGDINFLDPGQFLQFANQQANQIKDEKERRAYLEMIAKLMNYKDKEGEETEQIRAYLPLQCYSCELKKRCEACKFAVCAVEI